MQAKRIDFEKFYKPDWTENEQTNLKVVCDFVQGILDKDFDRIIDKYATSTYIQHNRSIESGVEAIVNANRKLAKRFPEYLLDPKYIYVEGDSVIFHSHLTLQESHRGNDRKGLNVVDIWKIENGRIVEHWDAIQPLDFMSRLVTLLTGGAIRNDNGVF